MADREKEIAGEGRSMTKEDLVGKIGKLLKAGDLDFLLKLELKELETLVARIRERVDGSPGIRC